MLSEEEEKSILWYILGPILGVIFLLLIIYFIIKYIRLKNANLNLKDEVKSIAYSHNVEKNVITKVKKTSEKESDYESTFI